MRSFYFVCCLFFGQLTTVYGQFSGEYAPSNWTISKSPASNGSINTSTAPLSITITGSDNATPTNDVDTDFTITTIASGAWSFAWTYHTNDSYSDAQYDIAGVLINGIFTQLSDNAGALDQSGIYNGGTLPAGTVIGFRIRATDNTYGDATFTISNFARPSTTLPVSLLNFVAQKSGSQVVLHWNTEKEENTDRFEVQHSTNGNQFHIITSIAARGNSSASTSYSTVDASPAAGYNYYRLRIIDKDGAATFSKIVSVNIGHQNNIRVYPTQARGSLSITFASLRTGDETFAIYTSSGALVKKTTASLTVGENKVIIPVEELPKGHYFIKTSNSGATERFIKE